MEITSTLYNNDKSLVTLQIIKLGMDDAFTPEPRIRVCVLEEVVRFLNLICNPLMTLLDKSIPKPLLICLPI